MKAFTLIEITISLLILAIGLVGILTLFPVGFDASGRASSITEATFLAQELIEDAKRVGYGHLAVSTTAGTFTAPHANYDYDMFVYDEAAIGVAASLGLHEVVVRVYWPHRDDADRTQQRSVELSTYLAQYEM